MPMVDWTVATLPASDETMLRTDGTLLYAYRGASTDQTLGGITFQAGADLSSANISFNPTFNNADENAGSTSLLGTAWNFGVDTGMGEIRLTLSGLTAGHAYLLQILARNSFGNPSITIGDLPAVSIQNGSGSSGATVYGSFTAEATSHVVTFKMGGSGAARYVAAIQVRDLGEAGGGGFQDWPEDPDTAITDATSPADLGLTGGAFAEAGTTTAELRRLSKWARANGVPFGGADVNAMSFDADGNPDNALSAAYLLNCAVAGLDEAKAAFRFAGIDPGTVPSIAGTYNGTVTVFGADAPSGPWQPATDQHHFYRAILTR